MLTRPSPGPAELRSAADAVRTMTICSHIHGLVPPRPDASLLSEPWVGTPSGPLTSSSKGRCIGLFGNRNPKLPSYIGVGLEALLQDPQWAYAIDQAGIDPARCEIVLRLAEPTVGSGGVPVSPKPAILFGQGDTLAIAHPAEREIKVVKRDKAGAELQTQRSGWFQILFGPAQNLMGFMFYGPEDNLRLGTPEGDRFGEDVRVPGRSIAATAGGWDTAGSYLDRSIGRASHACVRRPRRLAPMEDGLCDTCVARPVAGKILGVLRGT